MNILTIESNRKLCNKFSKNVSIIFLKLKMKEKFTFKLIKIS